MDSDTCSREQTACYKHVQHPNQKSTLIKSPNSYPCLITDLSNRALYSYIRALIDAP